MDYRSLPVHFAPARGGRIAYQVFGDGPTTMVAIPPSAQNIEVGWEWPGIEQMLVRFASFCRFVHFDKRGTGSSDRTSLVPGIDERVDDLQAVMDHAGIERAHLFAQSEGQADFAARWGTSDSTVVDLFTPTLADDGTFRRWHQRYERVAATADSLRDLFAQMLDMDVREVVPDITAPGRAVRDRSGSGSPGVGVGGP